ncbi:MAG TPA: hypothetical protein DEH22_07110, partial [Chloroflexi bacterium]|nr:hypothetical protein [Chloroflexota bacterium]
IPEVKNPSVPALTAPTLTAETKPQETVTTSEAGKTQSAEKSHLPCLGGMLPLAILPILGVFALRKRKIA